MPQRDNAVPQPTLDDQMRAFDERYEAERNEQLVANVRIVSNMRYDGALSGVAIAAVTGVKFGYQVANNPVSSSLIGSTYGLFGGFFGSMVGSMFRLGCGDHSPVNASSTAHFNAQVQSILSGVISGGLTYGTALVTIRLGATKEQAQWIAPVIVAGGAVGLKHGKAAVSKAASGIYKMGQYCCGFLTRRNQPSEAQQRLVPAAASTAQLRPN